MRRIVLHVFVSAAVAVGAFLVGTRFSRGPAAEVQPAEGVARTFLADNESGPRVPFLLFRETDGRVIEPVRVAPDNLFRTVDLKTWDRETQFRIQWDPAQRCHTFDGRPLPEKHEIVEIFTFFTGFPGGR